MTVERDKFLIDRQYREELLSKEEVTNFLQEAIHLQDLKIIQAICTLPSPNKPDLANDTEQVKSQLIDACAELLGAESEAISQQIEDEYQRSEALLQSPLWVKFYNINRLFPEAPTPLEEGPLMLNDETKQLMALTKDLMNPENKFSIESRDSTAVDDKEAKDHFIVFANGKEYNWSQIQKFADFQHTVLDDEHLSMFARYMQSALVPDEAKPQFHIDASELTEMKQQLGTTDDAIACREFFLRKLYADDLATLATTPKSDLISFQEMQAINAYTSGFYTKINGCMRDVDYVTKGEHNTVRAAIINAVFCASGLSKIPQKPIAETYRGCELTLDELDAYITAAASSKTENFKGFRGFMSSSTTPEASFNKNTVLRFTKLRGAEISCLSKSPGEKEYLIPPSQIKLTSYQQAKAQDHFGRPASKHVFDCELVSSLNKDPLIEHQRRLKAQVQELSKKKDEHTAHEEAEPFIPSSTKP
jgi:hypothetical protein